MLLPNARRILKMGPSPTTFKLLLMAGAASRPSIRRICLSLLRLFEHQGGVSNSIHVCRSSVQSIHQEERDVQRLPDCA